LQATVDGNTAAIETEQTARTDADGRLFGQYTVKIDLNGNVSGFGLAASSATDPASEFMIRADRFSIVSPTYNKNSPDAKK